MILLLEPHNAGAGIEDGSIKDTQMKSSNHPNDPYPAREARLNQNGAWCGNLLRKHLFLQIDFLSNFEGVRLYKLLLWCQLPGIFLLDIIYVISL